MDMDVDMNIDINVDIDINIDINIDKINTSYTGDLLRYTKYRYRLYITIISLVKRIQVPSSKYEIQYLSYPSPALISSHPISPNPLILSLYKIPFFFSVCTNRQNIDYPSKHPSTYLPIYLPSAVPTYIREPNYPHLSISLPKPHNPTLI